MLRGNSYVPDADWLAGAIEQFQCNATLGVDPGDDAGCRRVELELQLVAAAMGAAGNVPGVVSLEDDALGVFLLKTVNQSAFRFRLFRRFHGLDRARPMGEHLHKQIEPLAVGKAAMIGTVHFQQVEGKEFVPARLPVHNERDGDRVGRVDERFWQADGQPSAVNANGLGPCFLDENPLAVELLLHTESVVGDKAFHLLFLDCVQ